nr:hypothetical protein [uncultured Mediterranean phage uvMED]
MTGFMLGLMQGIKDVQVETAKNEAKFTKAFQQNWDETVAKADAVLAKDKANDAVYKKFGEAIVKTAKLQQVVNKLPGDAQFDESGLIKLGYDYNLANKLNNTTISDFAGNTASVLKDVIKNNTNINPYNTVKPVTQTDTTSQDTQTESAFGGVIREIAGGVAGSMSPSFKGQTDRANYRAATSDDTKAVMARGNTPKDYGQPITTSRAKLTLPQQRQMKTALQESLVLNLPEYLEATKNTLGGITGFKSKEQSDTMIKNAQGNMLALVDILVNKNAFESQETGAAAQFIVNIIKEAESTTDYKIATDVTVKNKLGEVLNYISNMDENTLYNEIQNKNGTEFYNEVINQLPEKTLKKLFIIKGTDEKNDEKTGTIKLRNVDFSKVLGKDDQPVFRDKTAFLKWFNSPESMKDKSKRYGLYTQKEGGVDEHIIKLPDGRVATVNTKLSPKRGEGLQVLSFIINPEGDDYENFIRKRMKETTVVPRGGR